MPERDLTDPMDALLDVGDRLLDMRVDYGVLRRRYRDDVRQSLCLDGAIAATSRALQFVEDVLRDVRAAKAEAAHPDAGGSNGDMARLNRARDQAFKERGDG